MPNKDQRKNVPIAKQDYSRGRKPYANAQSGTKIDPSFDFHPSTKPLLQK